MLAQDRLEREREGEGEGESHRCDARPTEASVHESRGRGRRVILEGPEVWGGATDTVRKVKSAVENHAWERRR